MRRHKICFTLLVIAFPLIFAAACTAAKFGNLSNGQAETFVPFAEGNLPEGIAIHKDVMYVSNSYPTVDGLVSEVLRIRPDGDVSVLTSFDATSNPDAFGRVGLAIGPGGDVLAAI